MDQVTLDQLAPRARLVHRLAEGEGFGLCGIAPAAASDHADWVRQWLADHKHGEMRYLAENLDKRLDPAALLPGAKCVIVVADAYVRAERPSGQVAECPSAEEDQEPEQRRHQATGVDHLTFDIELSTSAISSRRSDNPHTPHPAPDTRSATSAIRRQPSDIHTPTGQITSYGRGRDYHKTVKKRLHRLADALADRHPSARFKCTCDTAPTLEREHAQGAGLGWAGKHTLLLHPRHGSFFFLGCIVTDLPIQTSAEAGYPGDLLPPTDHCGTCTRCIDACPTRCIDDPDETGHRSIDAARCISYLTIEHRSTIDVSLHASMGDWLAGCDVCQQVCPYNGGAGDRGPGTGVRGSGGEEKKTRFRIGHQPSAISHQPFSLPVHQRYTPILPPRLALVDILDWTEADYQRALQGSALKRIKLPMWKRNALIVAGNYLAQHEEATLRKRIDALAVDESEPEMVRVTAQQVRANL